MLYDGSDSLLGDDSDVSDMTPIQDPPTSTTLHAPAPLCRSSIPKKSTKEENARSSPTSEDKGEAGSYKSDVLDKNGLLTPFYYFSNDMGSDKMTTVPVGKFTEFW